MGTADRIERERLAKRARILDAARELFVERGVEAVTLREIAQRIEYSTTAIYVQFKDKQELLEQMVAEDFAAFSGALEAAGGLADPLERLAALHHAYVEFALSMPRHYQLLFLTPPANAKKDHASAPAQIAGYRLLLSTVEECIATERFRPELRDAHAVAQTIWSAVHGFVALQIVLGQAAAFHWRDVKELSAMALDMVGRGLLRTPPGPTPGKRLAGKNQKR